MLSKGPVQKFLEGNIRNCARGHTMHVCNDKEQEEIKRKAKYIVWRRKTNNRMFDVASKEYTGVNW